MREVDPPNASLAGSETDAVVELTGPCLENGSLSFAYDPIRADVPEGDMGVVRRSACGVLTGVSAGVRAPRRRPEPKVWNTYTRRASPPGRSEKAPS